MKKFEKYFIVAILLISAFIQKACQNSFPNKATDTTPPALSQVLIRLEASNPPNPRGEFDISSTDITRTKLDSSFKIKIIVLAADVESGIRNITIESNLTWQCSSGHNSGIIGIVQNQPLAFSSVTQPVSPQTPVQIEAEVKPISQTACVIDSVFGKGPVSIKGFVRAIATNGKGLKTVSKTFIFDYNDIGTP